MKAPGKSLFLSNDVGGEGTMVSLLLLGSARLPRLHNSKSCHLVSGHHQPQRNPCQRSHLTRSPTHSTESSLEIILFHKNSPSSGQRIFLKSRRWVRIANCQKYFANYILFKYIFMTAVKPFIVVEKYKPDDE